MKRRFRHIGTRLILSTAVMIALLVGMFSVATIMLHRGDLMYHVQEHAQRLSAIVQRALYYSMMKYDRENIEETIAQIGKEETIEKVRIFNKSGEIVYASDPGEVGTVVPQSEEGCVQCHAHQTPAVELRPEERWRILDKDGSRSFSVVTPIYNEPSCSLDACHQHPGDQQVLGVLYITKSLDNVDRELRTSRIFVVVFTVIIIVVICTFLAFFVRRFVRRPVIELAKGVARVDAGDLDHKIPVTSRTEIGDLAQAFNQMTVDLKRARREIEEWGHSLEDRVRERTAELEETQSHLLRSEKLVSLGKLAASVAHEINNPLMGILTFVRTFQGWIQEGEFPAEKTREFRRDLEIMGEETKRISRIVRSLLAFARRSRLDRQEQDINLLLRQCAELLNHQLDLQEIGIVLDLAENLPPIRVDGGQIQQAVMNLMINGAEAMGSGGTLTVRSSLTEDREKIRIGIADTGAGIAEDIMEKLFDPFFTTKEPGKGTGLGLPVTFGIIDNHGGTIDVKSVPGQGTEFRITLPVSSEAESSAGPDDVNAEES
jgi:two-component system NtrC family sensor kinase